MKLIKYHIGSKNNCYNFVTFHFGAILSSTIPLCLWFKDSKGIPMNSKEKISNCEVTEESVRELLELCTMLPPFPFRSKMRKTQEEPAKLLVQPKA